MKLKNIITAASLALLPFTAGAATLIVPAAASAPGANGSVWKSELTLHDTGANAIPVAMIFHDQSGATQSASVSVPAHGTIALDDVVRTTFQRENSVGAIEIDIAGADLNHLAVTSRTANVLQNGELGQDIPAILSTDAANAGDVAVILGPSSATAFRFNAGLYALTAATVQWTLVRADGTVAATKTASYAAGAQNQFGVPAFFGVDPADSDVVQASIFTGSLIFYGSIIDQGTGDPSFVPGVRNRDQSHITFVGIDRDENGTVDISAHNDTLDSPVDSYTLGFPTYFRIVTTTDSGEPVQYTIVSSTADARFVDNDGGVQMVSSAALQGTTGQLVVRATTTDGQSAILTIPVKFF